MAKRFCHARLAGLFLSALISVKRLGKRAKHQVARTEDVAKQFREFVRPPAWVTLRKLGGSAYATLPGRSRQATPRVLFRRICSQALCLPT